MKFNKDDLESLENITGTEVEMGIYNSTLLLVFTKGEYELRKLISEDELNYSRLKKSEFIEILGKSVEEEFRSVI